MEGLWQLAELPALPWEVLFARGRSQGLNARESWSARRLALQTEGARPQVWGRAPHSGLGPLESPSGFGPLEAQRAPRTRA